MIFVIGNHKYQRAGFLNSAGILTGSIYSSYYNLGEYLNLGTLNEKLMEENAILRSRGSITIDTTSTIDICDDSAQVVYHYIPTKVINFTVHKSNNYITLSKGSKAGISRDMGVVASNGIAGIVINVSGSFSTAMSVLHKDTRISVKLKRFNYPGTLQWGGGSPQEAEIIGIPMHLPIELGDTVVTSGFSAIFPENIPVGIISKLRVLKGSSFYSINVHLSANLETLQFAYVVNNLFQEEQQKLEEMNSD